VEATAVTSFKQRLNKFNRYGQLKAMPTELINIKVKVKPASKMGMVRFSVPLAKIKSLRASRVDLWLYYRQDKTRQ